MIGECIGSQKPKWKVFRVSLLHINHINIPRISSDYEISDHVILHKSLPVGSLEPRSARNWQDHTDSQASAEAHRGPGCGDSLFYLFRLEIQSIALTAWMLSEDRIGLTRTGISQDVSVETGDVSGWHAKLGLKDDDPQERCFEPPTGDAKQRRLIHWRSPFSASSIFLHRIPEANHINFGWNFMDCVCVWMLGIVGNPGGWWRWSRHFWFQAQWEGFPRIFLAFGTLISWKLYLATENPSGFIGISH